MIGRKSTLAIQEPMDEETLSLIFNGTEEIVNIVKGGGLFVPELRKESRICPLIGTTIEFTKELGKGVQGSVFEIKFPGQSVGKRYVAKRMNATHSESYTSIDIPKGTNVLEFLKKMKTFGISKRDIEEANGTIFGYVDPAETFLKRRLNLPSFIEDCLVADPVEITDATSGKQVTFRPPLYMCASPGYSEYYCSLLVASLYRKGKCINFIDTFSFATCGDSDGTNQYIFMEQIDTTLFGFYTSVKSAGQADGLVVQMLFALEIMQQKYKLQHNDLHAENMFIERIRPGTTWGGTNLIEADWFAYKIDNVILYIPTSGIIMKIGDFGMSVKYKTPVVGSKYIMREGARGKTGKPGDIGDRWHPNTYTPGYDTVMVVSEFMDLFPSAIIPKLLVADMIGVQTSNVSMDILQEDIDKKLEPMWQDGENWRIKISEFGRAPLKNITPGKLLKSNAFFKYRKLPPAGKTIVFLGEI